MGLFTFIFIHMIIQAKLAKEYYDNKISAELGFLQAQIKPHFLYNALNTVIEISKTDIDKSRELLIDFSYYLRGSFDFKESSQFVDLEKEIESAKAYLEIEKARFKEPIEVIFDITEDVQVKVPRIILQPIIENAIIHGILPKNQGGKIQVSIIREKEILVFSVTDNGVGMNENKLNQVFNDMDKDGIGIANIEKRLMKLYGKGLEIKSKPKLGTQIQWEIPLKRQRNKDDK